MSIELTSSTAEPPAAADRPRRPGRPVVVLAIVVVLAVLATGITLAVRGSSGQPASAPRSSASPSSTSPSRAQQRAIETRAVRNLLRRRSRAVLHHDAEGLTATIDPTQRQFLGKQLTMLANLRAVPFASWSYTFDELGSLASSPRSRRYGVRTFRPLNFALHYRLKRYDASPTDLPQFPTFTERDGRWYLASLSDFAGRDDVSATDLWDYGRVQVVRAPGVLALGLPDQEGTTREAAEVASLAIAQVTAVWGSHWPQRVVLLVPSNQRQLGLINADTGNLDQIAALSSAEVRRENGRPAPVGGRVSINPANWATLGSIGRQVVVTHELAHVASRAATGRQTPDWLVEGFADYVGFLNSGVDVRVGARELAADVQRGDVPSRLPTRHDFRGGNVRLAQAYESGWLACRYIAERFGQTRLVRFYRAVGTVDEPQQEAVVDALRTVLHLTPTGFTARWRDYVREQLG